MSEQIQPEHTLEAITSDVNRIIPDLGFSPDLSFEEVPFDRIFSITEGVEPKDIKAIAAIVNHQILLPPVDVNEVKEFLILYVMGYFGPLHPLETRYVPKESSATDIFAVSTSIGPVVLAATETQRYQAVILPSDSSAGHRGSTLHKIPVRKLPLLGGASTMKEDVQMTTAIFESEVYDVQDSIDNGGWHAEMREFPKKQELDWNLIRQIGEKGIPVPLLAFGHHYQTGDQVVLLSSKITLQTPVRQTLLLPDGTRYRAEDTTFNELIREHYMPTEDDFLPYYDGRDSRNGAIKWQNLTVGNKYHQRSVTPASVSDAAYLVNPDTNNCYMNLMRFANREEVMELVEAQVNREILDRLDSVTQ